MNYYIEMFVAKESHEGSSDGRFSQIFIGKLLDKVNRTTVFKTDSNGHLTAHQPLLEIMISTDIIIFLSLSVG